MMLLEDRVWLYWGMIVNFQSWTPFLLDPLFRQVNLSNGINIRKS